MHSYLHANSLCIDWGTAQCYAYREKIFRRHPDLAYSLAQYYCRIANEHDYVEANRRLGRLHKKLTLGPQFHGIYIDSPEEQVKLFAEKKSLAVLKHLGETRKSKGEKAAIAQVMQLILDCGLRFPLEKPQGANKEEIAGAIARCCDADWWRRQIRRRQDEVIEHVHITIGRVSKNKGIYISNFSLGRKQQQWKRNTKTLAMLIARNDLGEEFSLLEIAKRSVSNLELRRNELMTRISGFEGAAKARGDSCVFYTLTAPSKYHACLSKGAIANPKYSGANPKDTQQYFNQLWRRTRAKLGRLNIRPYGMRVVEPHHDGTPHWHLLLFVKPNQQAQLTKTLREYALAEDGNEPGAHQYRLKVEHIDPNKGSAAGYIAKYIAKNIDGEHVGEDNYGKNAIESATRIRAWASTWCIRQFQAIGGPSATVWREARRFANNESAKETLSAINSHLLDQIIQAADDGDWQSFVELSGGPNCKRAEQPLRAYQVAKDTPNKYGEITNRILGLLFAGQKLIKTRVRQWTVHFIPEFSNSPLNNTGFATGGANAPPLEFCQ